MVPYNAKSVYEISFYPEMRVTLHNWHVCAAELEESHYHIGRTEASEIYDPSNRRLDEIELEDKNLPKTLPLPQ